MKKYITANLKILETWLMGGNNNDGFFYFQPAYDEFVKENFNSLERIEEEIIYAIKELNEDFNYYGKTYKFKVPSAKNLKILAKRIKKIQESQMK